MALSDVASCNERRMKARLLPWAARGTDSSSFRLYCIYNLSGGVAAQSTPAIISISKALSGLWRRHLGGYCDRLDLGGRA